MWHVSLKSVQSSEESWLSALPPVLEAPPRAVLCFLLGYVFFFLRRFWASWMPPLTDPFLMAISLEKKLETVGVETRCAALAYRAAAPWSNSWLVVYLSSSSEDAPHSKKRSIWLGSGWLHSTFIRIPLKDHCMCCTWTPVCTHIPAHLHKL